jgi:predicted dehydrogenase
MIKIGIIGMSPGNAHPTSWSAIINGTFNADTIVAMGFPAVAAYLQANKATLGLPGASVTHVLTQDKALSAQIALSAGIQHVAESVDELINAVDAVLLCKDDPEEHREMAKPFIDANIPIFIDKPLCNTQADLDYFVAEVAKGKFIMSCSSQRYASEYLVAKSELKALGKIDLITAVGKKDWTKYGVHLLEGILSLLDDPKPISIVNVGRDDAAVVKIDFEGGLQVTIHLMMDIVVTFQVSLFGQQNWRLIDIKNSYSMFRDNIIEFIRSVQEGKPRLEFAKTEQIIKTLIAGNESLKQGGKKIIIN